jgi:hypothetical protein
LLFAITHQATPKSTPKYTAIISQSSGSILVILCFCFQVLESNFASVVRQPTSAQLLLEIPQPSLPIDEETFESDHFCEILDMLAGRGLAEDGVMWTTGVDPRCGRRLQVGAW